MECSTQWFKKPSITDLTDIDVRNGAFFLLSPADRFPGRSASVLKCSY